ncbi:MAG: metallophosphoesterase [Gemmatimonadaceae bacterium]|nr:metallophosphoesterase [Gemmatimonadaceae bacterium]
MSFAPMRVLHISDIHCGHPFVAEHVAAAESLAASQAFNAIVVSGDMAQRARVHEFERARDIVNRFRAIAPTLVVPGNHDTAWWHAPFGFGDVARMHERYRQYISDDLEPTLRLPGLSIVGLNSAQGTMPATLTWYPRDWRVKGGLTTAQLERARACLAASPAGDLRLLVVHHNVVRGRLSRRWGLARPLEMLDAIAVMRPHVVCSGHDHEERVEVVERATGRFIASTANTLSNRMRRHRPSSLTVIEAQGAVVTVTAWVFQHGAFVPGPMTASLGTDEATIDG